MSLKTLIQNVAVRTATEFNTLRAEIAASIGGTYTQAQVDALIATAKQEAIDAVTGNADIYTTLQLVQTELAADDTQAANILATQGGLRTDVGTDIANADFVADFEAALAP